MNTEQLLELLVCPKCHAQLRAVGPSEAPTGFGCEACQLLFATEDGLPNMLISHAQPWSIASIASAAHPAENPAESPTLL